MTDSSSTGTGTGGDNDEQQPKIMAEEDNANDESSKIAAAAEEQKELGNQAFASKNYQEAINYYTKAISLNPTNHIYYSNRSASYGGLNLWSEASKDATECLRLDPTFIKGFFRLVTAQIELNDLDGATTTVRRGLELDPQNTQLQKQLRIINGKKKDATKQKTTTTPAAPAADVAKPGTVSTLLPNGVDTSVQRELIDLQRQLTQTTQDYNITRARVTSCQREKQITSLTITELSKLDNDSNNTSSASTSKEESKMYRGIGRMFVLSNRDEIMGHLNGVAKEETKREVDLTSKMEYLEKRMKSQRSNIEELVGSGKALPAGV